MQAGLVGFAGGGKSTLFELLTGDKPDSGKIHSGQKGMAEVADPRIDFLTGMHHPKKVTRAKLELLDTPGLLPGSHGDNPQRLALIREADALMIVISDFAGGDPVAELAAFREEILFADLGVVTNRVERLEANIKKPRPDRDALAKELETVKLIQTTLESGGTIAELDLSADDKKPLRSFGLLTDKAQVVLLNTVQGREPPEALKKLVPSLLALDAKLELELTQLDAEDRVVFMADMGLTEFGRDRIIRLAYDAVGVITFLTAGEPEVRGWNLERGGSAVDAAGKIHTDLARGFIRAEVTAFEDLKRLGSMKEVKAKNLTRLEGKDYIVKDGDVVFFRSNA